ncbi:NAD(P)-binding protein [Hypoxylon cercidicola]|nr:NAD(P)-binding protein [Hypoxylon cercidicola]
MGNILARNEFPVQGRTVVVTGASRGMGLAVGRQLAEKGANVAIVARDQDRLLQALEHIQQGATDPRAQRFLQIKADLTSSSESVRVIEEVTAWNSGNPPDIVWCCAGSAHPTLFVDTPVSTLQAQMDTNYFTGLYMAHATLQSWLKSPEKAIGSEPGPHSGGAPAVPPAARHLVFTASFLSFCSYAGYTPYSPAKAALRSLADTLSQEMNLYAAARPAEPRVRLHTVFPAAILTEGFEAENLVKTDLTKMIEEVDKGQTPEVVAEKSIKALEGGQEMVTTDMLTSLVKRSMLGASLRGGFLRGLVDWLLACIMGIAMVLVRDDTDRKVRAWGRKYGASGMKDGNKLM